MSQSPELPSIYQLRIVLREISPLIWRRLLVCSDTTLANLHTILQIVFDWSGEHLHTFHLHGKDYGSNGADTRHVWLSTLRLRCGERFWYVYDYGAHWQCEFALKRSSPVIPRVFILYVLAPNRPHHPRNAGGPGRIWRGFDQHGVAGVIEGKYTVSYN